MDAYLHGVEENDEATTEAIWREEVSRVTGDLLNDHRLKDLLDAYPIKPHEVLQDRSYRMFEAIKLIAKRAGEAARLDNSRRSTQLSTAHGEAMGAKHLLLCFI